MFVCEIFKWAADSDDVSVYCFKALHLGFTGIKFEGMALTDTCTMFVGDTDFETAICTLQYCF